MHPHLQKQINSDKNNQTKKLYKEMMAKFETKKEAEEVLDEMYSEYRKLFNAQQFNEKEFCDFAYFIFETMEREDDKLTSMVDDLSKSHLYTVKIHILNHKEIYRTIKIPSIYFMSDLVHCALASFDLLTLEPYIAEFKDAKFYCNHLFKKIQEKELKDDVFPASEMPLEFLELSKGQKIYISYGLDSWILVCEVISSSRNKTAEENPTLLNAEGKIIPFDNMETTILMINKNYKELLGDDYSQKEIDEMKKVLETSLYIEDMKQLFPNAICVLSEYYESEVDDEESEFLNNRQERNDKLDEKDHIKTYNEARKIFENLVPVLANEFEKNEKKYVESARKIFDNRLEVAIKNKHDISYHNFQIEAKDVDNIFSCYMFPLDNSYESVAQYLLKTNKIKDNKEKQMLEAAIESKVGLYKITYNNVEDALINVMDVKTNETIPIVDKNLSYGLGYFDGQIYICGRIINYHKVNFMSNAIVLIEDKEVKQLVRDIKNNNFTSIDYFQRALIIQNKQQK